MGLGSKFQKFRDKVHRTSAGWDITDTGRRVNGELFDDEKTSGPFHRRLKDFTSGGADDLARRTAELEEQRYQEMYRPLNQDLIDSLGVGGNWKHKPKKYDPGIDFEKQARQNAARQQRELRRYGVGLSAEDRAEQSRVNKLNDAAQKQFTLDNAYRNEYERREALKGEMINIGRGMAQSAQSGLDRAAANATNRKNANAAAEHADDVAQQQMATSLISTAIMAFAMS